MKAFIVNELRECRIAQQMTLSGYVQFLGVEPTDGIAQIQFAIVQVLDLFPANHTQVTFLALRHIRLTES
jgi:hypothetical protein